ncbi:MAG: LPS export ABC transporter permease LptG [Rickettsiella sp.]|nr:LPS export ABC transporter permease LptG [Rickettsiella sp.]
MKIIERYLGRTVISTTLSVLGVLLALFALIQLIAETRDIGYGHYTLLSAFYYVLLTLPSQFYTFSPIAFLLGTILGLGLLARHSELIILNASGISLYKIAWSLFKATLLIVLFTILIGEGLAPRAASLAESHKAFLTTSGQTLMTQQGALWIRDGYNFIYIQSILNPTHLNRVSRYQFDTHNNLLKASFAKEVNYEKNSWKAEDVVTSHLSPKKINASHTDYEIWPLSFSPKLLNISIILPEQMSLKQLNEYIRYRKKNLLNTSQYSLAFWQRILQPLAIWIMMCLAIPFTFKHLRSLATSLRTITGIIVGFGFYLLNEFFGPFAIVYQWPPFLAALLPLLIFIIIAGLLMYWAD